MQPLPAVRPRLAALCAMALSLLAGAAGAPGASAAAAPPSYSQRLEDQGVRTIIVARRPGLGAAARARLRAGAGVEHVRDVRLSHTEIVRADAGRLTEALAELEADPRVRHAEPDAPVYAEDLHGDAAAQTLDAYWSLQWGLESPSDADIDADEAWPLSEGAGQTVAVVDTGSTFSHPDLAGQFAANPGETGAGRERNGIDDDGNGLVDDHRGYDFVERDNDPADANGHGTHVAGVIAALKDNHIGIAGVAPRAKVLTLRVLGAGGSGTVAAMAEAFDYAGDLGVPVVNASLSTAGGSPALRETIASHPDTLYVVAASNGGDDGIGDDNDVAPVYPCAFPEENVVCVGASDGSDRPAAFSNHGAATVDLFAPGLDVVSTFGGAASGSCAGSAYCFMSGTSQATPHVAGVLALMRAAAPGLDAAALKAALLAGAESKDALAGTSMTGGRLDASAAVAGAVHADRDRDADGVLAESDNCPGAANPAQADADADGLGDACDPTPQGDGGSGGDRGSQPVEDRPAGPVATQPVAGDAGSADPGAAAATPVAPVIPPATAAGTLRLTRLKLSRTTLTASRPIVVSLRVTRPASVELAIARRVGSRYRTVRVVTRVAGPRGLRYELRRRMARTTLKAGAYRLTVRATGAGRAASVRFRVR